MTPSSEEGVTSVDVPSESTAPKPGCRPKRAFSCSLKAAFAGSTRLLRAWLGRIRQTDAPRDDGSQPFQPDPHSSAMVLSQNSRKGLDAPVDSEIERGESSAAESAQIRLDPAAPALATTGPPAAMSPCLKGAHVLMVEDNAINQLVGRQILEAAGVVVSTADDGVQALKILGQQPVDLILMDLLMPVMDGMTATLHIRQNPAWAHLPVVAMTASSTLEDEQRCRDAGMTAFLAKPVEPEQMWAVVAQQLADRAISARVS